MSDVVTEPIYIWWSEVPGRGEELGFGGDDIYRCREHPAWYGASMGTWEEWLAQCRKWDWSQQKAAAWWKTDSVTVHQRKHLQKKG
jgi:hypothetical protein